MGAKLHISNEGLLSAASFSVFNMRVKYTPAFVLACLLSPGTHLFAQRVPAPDIFSGGQDVLYAQSQFLRSFDAAWFDPLAPSVPVAPMAGCGWRIIISAVIPQDSPSCYDSAMRHLWLCNGSRQCWVRRNEQEVRLCDVTVR